MRQEKLRYASVCSGIEAPSVGWESLGWTPVFFAEIEAFPSALLAQLYPDVPNLGDFTRINPDDWRGQIDLLVAGTPCQAFSVAGQRESLSDHRGNLTLAFVELVHGIDPEFILWENVPGVLSTDDNAFGCFLAGLVGANEPVLPRTSDGRWTSAGVVCGPRRAAAWRILDAQYIAVAGDSAVPQRRARVFVLSRNFRGLGRLETSSPERNADRVCGLLAEILFESESLPRHSAPCREAGTRTASTLTRGAESSGKGGYAGPRCLNAGGTGRLDFETETLIPVTGGFFDQPTHALRADGFDASEDGTGRGTPIIPILEVGKRCGNRDSARNGVGVGDVGDPMFTLQSGAQHGVCAPIPIDMRQASRGATMTNNRAEDKCSGGAPGTGLGEPGDPSPTVSTSHIPAVAFAFAQNTRDEVRLIGGDGSIAGALAGEPGMKQQTYVMVQDDAQIQMREVRRGDDQRTEPRSDIESAGINDPVSEVRPFAFETRIARNGRGQPSEVAPSLKASEAGQHGDSQPHVADRYGVRRITPIEAERLQGFPDNYMLITYRGKPAADGPRYKALGNSMCTKVMRWLGWRIDRAWKMLAEMEAT